MSEEFVPAREYACLHEVLMRAYRQAAEGKGLERHGRGRPFREQPVMQISRMMGAGFPLGQAMKKIAESENLNSEKAVAELLGAIVYVAAAVLAIEEGIR